MSYPLIGYPDVLVPKEILLSDTVQTTMTFIRVNFYTKLVQAIAY